MNLNKRYQNNKIKLNEFNKAVYTSMLYPTIYYSNSDIFITTDESDRLDLLAHKYYGDVRYWWIIAQANHLGKGSFVVPPGIRLRIPKNLNSIDKNLESINKLR